MCNSIVLFVGLGRHDNASVKSLSFPGLYWMVQSYGWSWRSMHFRQGGAAISSSLLSSPEACDYSQ